MMLLPFLNTLDNLFHIFTPNSNALFLSFNDEEYFLFNEKQADALKSE